ncbi:MAG TPA: DUF4190 domain-containing protein [Pseudolysinimonas sp.]|nr:DUF4190 domain-containing protein [Pseudolysinimonas sp.]
MTSYQPPPPGYVSQYPAMQQVQTQAPRPRLSPLALSAVLVAAGYVFLLVIGRSIAASLAYSEDDLTAVASIFGVVGAMSVVVIAVPIVLGHLALGQTVRGRMRGRALAGVGLGAGYLLLVWWASRVLNAAIASFGAAYPPDFFPQMFWWA